MEALSPTMEEGRLITWLTNEGDQINEGDVLAEVETDKATMELVARGSGVLRKRLTGEGDTTAVGTLIGVIAAADEDIAALVGADGASGSNGGGAAAAPAAEAPAEPAPAAAAAQAEAAPAAAAPPPLAAAPAQQPPSSTAGADGGRVKASPLARRLAEEQGVTLQGLQGSGPGGRIVKRDIEAAAQAGPAAGAPAGAAPAAAPAAAPGAEFQEIAVTQMRKTIAKRLTQSIGPIPTFYLTVEIDMTETMALRKKINERFADQGVKVSPNDLIIKSVAMALLKHPWINAAWIGDTIRQYSVAHVAVAVAVEDGLITPVIRNAHQKTVSQIAQEVRELAGRAREKKLKPEEYSGSTFSISSLGMFGIEEFTAIINPPEAAILAVGTITDKVVALKGDMAVRPMMKVTLSCDHRVIDGATGAQFLQTLKGYLEEPMLMIA
ncbi:MAG: pyruvate dehydrogenase complex dihydrolipoamide acetyltransferase [Gemmatimonadetes bacterium]|nr:pyruvate dehydrogenase complex dihydrolipoamide acetyltransferase [Gemmatimonadota bacterium]